MAGIHAIGDAAVELAVECLVAAIDKHPRENHRHYLNHFTVMPSSATMSQMAEYGIRITQHPTSPMRRRDVMWPISKANVSKPSARCALP